MSPRENGTQTLLRQLPSVDALLRQRAIQALQSQFGRPLTLEALRHTLSGIRGEIQDGSLSQMPAPESIAAAAEQWLHALTAPTLFPVINATGIIVHTNLGRAPLSTAALGAVQAVAAGYSTLEYDIAAGSRGSRTTHASQLVSRISGAEAAMVVNNNAAAVLLMLSALCDGREVIISRGQLVEIGGGFRIPDVMAQSGAKLVEVGTTNRTHLRDFEQAINENTGAILVAHHSNYQIIGFTAEPGLEELAALAHAHNLPLFYDQGSGALLDVSQFGLDHESTVSEAIADGTDLVAFSGDKLLGGPQAGLLAGKKSLIEVLLRHPLARAVRADKLALAALTATLQHYLFDEALEEIPVWQMISRSPTTLAETAGRWHAQLAEVGVQALVVDGRSRVGGGSLPGTSLPTTLVALTYQRAERLAALLRHSATPVISRVQDDQVLLDPRTVLPSQEVALLRTVKEVCGNL